MSETARVLRFPQRWRSGSTPEDANEVARQFWETGTDELSAEMSVNLADPDALASVCKLMRETLNTNPLLVAERASSLHRWIRAREGRCGFFDETEYFQGETALLAAGAFRILGERDQTESWLQRSEAGFRHTVNPGPLLAQCAYVRLALEYDKRRYQEVLELLPSLLESFRKFGMRVELAKARFLEAMALKGCSRREEAFEKFTTLCAALDELQETALLGQVCSEIGAHHAWGGRYDEAVQSYQKAMVFLSKSNRLQAVAELKMNVGETLQFQGRLASAIQAYREGIAAYGEVGMATYVAYGRIVLAQALMEQGRHREADWEIHAALPTIEEQKMVPEGFQAVTLLRNSVLARKTDPNALRELREHLKANG